VDRLVASGTVACGLGASGRIAPSGMERPRRVVRFARLIHRRVRAFWRTYGPRRLRRQSKPALVATHGDTKRVPQ
jgi:hypothetical protein